MILSYEDKTPIVPKSCWVAANATVVGDIVLGEECTVWYGAVLRADSCSMRIGNRCNVQDNAVFHCDKDSPLTLGEGVTVGHSAIVHGATVGDNVMVGMHATLMNHCIIGENSIIAAGALVKEGQVIPPNSLVVGVPAKVIRQVSPEQIEANRAAAAHYIEYGQRHKLLTVVTTV